MNHKKKELLRGLWAYGYSSGLRPLQFPCFGVSNQIGDPDSLWASGFGRISSLLLEGDSFIGDLLQCTG